MGIIVPVMGSIVNSKKNERRLRSAAHAPNPALRPRPQAHLEIAQHAQHAGHQRNYEQHRQDEEHHHDKGFRNQLGLHQMFDLDVTPSVTEVLGDESTMTVIRRLLAAEQASPVQQLARDFAFDSTLFHQIKKLLLVKPPVAFLFLVGVENVLRWRKLGYVRVLNATNRIHKEPEVVALREARQLRDIVQSHIDESLDASIPQTREEGLG